MSFEAHITKMDERPVPKLWLAKPDFTIIERINGVSNLSAKMNYMNENEISFEVNSHLFDEFTNEQYRNPTIEKMRNKYLIKMTYNNQTEWFIIENFSKTSDEKDYVPTTARYIGSELDKKWVGDIEEIGVTPAQLFNKFLPAIAPNWSVRSIDEKVAGIKREYTTSDASISTLIEEVCNATDAVVVFHNKDRQFSLVHRDNAGKFKGLKVKEATYLKGFTDESNSQDLTTRLVLFGKDGLTINGVNPAGTDYIEDFSYYMRPFRRDSRRNVLEHSDYMSDALCHALLDFEEYFSNKTDEYEDLSEQYTNLLKEQLEEEFKLTEITAIKQRLEDRVELLKPQGNYTEKRILGNTSFDFKHNTRYIMVIQNNGTTARLTLNGEEQIIAGGQSGYFKIHTPPQVTNEDPQIKHTLQVLSASPNLMASLSTASEADFAEEDILEIEKKFNVYKYRELYTYQVGILAAVERRIKEYDNRRQSINDSLAVDTFFPPALVKERENFINWGVWREEDHTDAKELLEDGLKQLKEHNNVERTVTVSLIDFIQSLEDKENWDKLSAGDKIQFSNKIYDANMEAFISELNINFDNHDVSVTLSNIIDLKDRNRGIAQKMASFVSTAGKVNMQKSQLEDQLHKSNQVIALLEGEWDANKRRITAANETVSIDNRGIIVTSPSHPNEMLVAVAGVIAISNDGGETFKQAINTRGVVAERLIGKVLIGTELVMENNAGTFRFDNEGVRINASNFHLIADDGEDYFDTLMRRMEQEVVTGEERIKGEIESQKESLQGEISDIETSLSSYTTELINALADGLLTKQEIHALQLRLNMLEAEYSHVRRRIMPIIYDKVVDPETQQVLFTVFMDFEEDYEKLISFIKALDAPTTIPQGTIDAISALLERFRPNLEELLMLIDVALEETQENRIANAEYNTKQFSERLVADLNDEVSDLKDSLGNLDAIMDEALTDGIITTVEKAQLSDALMRFESEKQDVDNRFHNTYNHAHIIGTANQASLQTAKTAYNSAYNTLIAKVKQILNMESVSHAIVEEYKALYQGFTTAVVAYSEEYERAVEFIQKGYADTAEGEAKKYTDGLRMEVEADVKDIHDNIIEFETDVYGAFKDGIITEQERNRLGIHHDMLEKEKSDLIERYDTIITSDYLQGFYDVEQLVTTRSLYGQVHADLLLALELAMMDSKITKEESQEATRLFALYVQRLTQFSKELELAIAALGESKAVAHTNEQLNNYMSLSVFNDEIAMLQAEIDGHIMTWYYDHEPTLSTLPASDWKDDKTRNAHVGDLFYHESEGHAFRFMRKSGGGYEWQLIKDTEVTKALSDAQNALDLADDKRRVFVAQPTPPYDIGDLWIKGDGELMRARVNKEGKTQFSDLDWVKATKYTDDTVANQVGNQLNDYKTSNNREIQDLRDTLGAFRSTVEGAFKDGIIAEYELKILKTQMQSLDREKADVDAGYNQLLNHPNLTGAPKTKLQSAYTGFAETHNNLTAAINRVITDGVITESEYEEVMGLLDSYPIALTTYKNVMNETYLHLIEMAQNVADGALDIAGRLDTWKSSSFEVDVDKIATRVGESSWEEKWQPVVEQGINDAVDGIEVGGRNWFAKSKVVLSNNLRYDDQLDLYYNAGYNRSFSIFRMDSFGLELNQKYILAFEIKSDIPELELRANTYINGSVSSVDNNSPELIEGEWVKVYTEPFLYHTETTASAHIYFNQDLESSRDIEIRNIQINRGTILQDYQEAPEDTEARIAQTNKELKDVKDSLSTFEGTINTTFKDGVIEAAEAKAIKSHKAQLSKEKKDIDQKYTTIHGNSRLTGTAKTNLASAKTAFNTSHNSLISAIDNAIADGKATTAEYNTVISRFGDYEAKLATLTYRFEEANDYIGSAKATSAETNAKTHADTAAQNAKEAAEAYAKAKAEAERVLAEAHADGIVTAEEKARIADVNARLKEAKTHADTTSKAAEDAAKEYADTEISKIEIGGRNLALKTSEPQEQTTSAVRLRYDLNNETLRNNIGKEITISFEAKFDSNKSFTAYLLQLPSDYVVNSTPISGGTKNWKKFSFTGVIGSKAEITTNAQFTLATSDYGAIRNLKVELGNKATDWTPAPEDIENQFKMVNSNAYGLNEELTKVFKDGIISEAEATAIGDSINLVKSDYENVMKRYANVYANTGLVGTAKTNLLSARNAYNTSYNSLINHITAVVSSGNITSAQRTTYNTRFSDYRVKIGDLSDAIESAWDSIVNDKLSNIGSENLLPYSSTQGIVDNWITVEQGADRRTSLIKPTSGTPAYQNTARIYSSSVEAGQYFGVRSPRFPRDIIEGETYTLSFKTTNHASSHTDMRYTYLMREGQSGTNQGSFNLNSTPITRPDGVSAILHTVTFKAEFSGGAGVMIATRSNSNVAAQFHLYEPMLVQGSVIPQWSESPNDQIQDFYNTEIKANYSTTTQTKELLGSYVTSTELKGNLDKIATYSTSYSVGQGSGTYLREANESVFDDAFSYEVTAHTPSVSDSLVVVVLNSKGKGKGWDVETLEEKGTTGSHPRIYFSGSYPAVTKWVTTTKSEVQVIYTKYAGSFTNLSKTSSMIEQKADSITSRVANINSNRPNIVPYTDFTVDSENWGTSGSSNWYALNTATRLSLSWDNYLLGNNNSSATTDFIGIFTPVFTQNVVSGNPITLSFLGAYPAQVENFNRIALRNVATGAYQWFSSPGSTVMEYTPVDHSNTSGGGFAHGLYTLTVTPNFSGQARFLIGGHISGDPTAAWIRINNVKVEKASNASAYTPSSNDANERWSQIQQTTNGISLEVGKKVGNDEIISKINQSAEKISIDANKINISGQSINIGANPAITGLNTSVGTAQSAADTAKKQADAARVGNNIVNALNDAKTTVNISGDRINIDATQIQLGAGATRSVNAELKNARDGKNIADSINNAPSSVSINADRINLTASSSIRLAINKAEKAGTDAQSTIDNLDVGSENLLPDSGWHKEPSGVYMIPDNWRRPVGGIVWSSRQSSNWLLARVNHSNDGTNGASTASYYGLRSPQILEPLIAGQEYTFTFKTRNSSGSNMNYRYTYIINDNNSNQSIRPVFIKNADNGGQLWSVTFTANHSDTGHILIGHSIPSGSTNAFFLKEPMLYKGNAISSWADSIQNKTDKDKIVSYINLDETGAQISGGKIDLIGDVDMVNGNTRIKSLNLNNATVTGGTGKNTITLNSNELISHGRFTRTWSGETDTAELNLGIKQGRVMVSNESTGYNLYFTEKGLSTTMAGATAGYSAGTLEFHSQRFNQTSRGVTLHSTFGTVALISDESTIVTRSKFTNNIESTDYSVYIRPNMNARPGTNEFQFYVKDNSSGVDTDGTILYGSSTYGSGIRFKKDHRDTPIVYTTNANGDIGTGDISVKDAEIRGSIRSLGDLYIRGWDGTGYNQIRTGAVNTYNSVILASHSGGNAYLGVGTSELRVTNNNGYNGGNTTYRDIRINQLHTTGGFQHHSSASYVYFGVGGATGMRITNNNLYNGGNIGWRDIEFRNWKANSHEKYKKDIEEWNTNVLDIFKNELQLYQYKFKDNLENNMIHRSIVLREDSTDDQFPAEWRQDDGYNGNEVMWWNTKAIQELAYENDELKTKNQELEERLEKLEQILLK